MKLSGVILFIAGLILGMAIVSVSYAARPGEVDDPLISQSYMKTGLAFRQVILGKDERLDIAPGQEFILIDGRVSLECPGDFQMYDISKGNSYENPRRVDRDHLVILLGNSTVSVVGERDAICLVRGLNTD